MNHSDCTPIECKLRIRVCPVNTRFCECGVSLSDRWKTTKWCYNCARVLNISRAAERVKTMTPEQLAKERARHNKNRRTNRLKPHAAQFPGAIWLNGKVV